MFGIFAKHIDFSGVISQGAHTGLSTLTNLGPMRIIRLHLHDGPMWASPKVSASLHMDSTDYIRQYMLHYVPFVLAGKFFIEKSPHRRRKERSQTHMIIF
jgi:hypothetical protein